jgi:asparaginyl-tRNA synthetase
MKTKHYNVQHILNLIQDPYYKNLVLFRNTVSNACDLYFQGLGAPKVDLFMVSKSVSSPSGKGSDSEPIPFTLGNQQVHLVDSAQFGMEPLVMKNFDIVYCYLPSFRDEDADERHINQFYHCETEIAGNLDKCMSIGEGLVKAILSSVKEKLSEKLFFFEENNFDVMSTLLNSSFPQVTFDEAEKILQNHGFGSLIVKNEFGRTITKEGETKIVELATNNTLPIWITRYDRNVVAFYQKPDPTNKKRVLNADLVFPSIDGCFGGEIIGLGQRQDNADELKELMQLQGIDNQEHYRWYIDLRKLPFYRTTSGFGLGIERLIA